MPEFNGAVALVTGGGRGLGAAICTKLATDGAAVAVADIDLAVAQELAERLAGEGVAASAYRHDVTSWQSSHEVVEAVERDLGDIAILVNNAGVSKPVPFLELSEAEWDRVLDVNLKGVFITLRAVLPGMAARRRGRVVNIGSISSKQPYPNFAHYGASKFGALGLSQTVAAEMAQYGVTINTVCPGIMETPLKDGLIREMLAGDRAQFSSEEEAKEWFKGLVPLGAAQPVEDVAELVAFLASDHARHMTGGSYHIDGGMVPR